MEIRTQCWRSCGAQNHAMRLRFSPKIHWQAEKRSVALLHLCYLGSLLLRGRMEAMVLMDNLDCTGRKTPVAHNGFMDEVGGCHCSARRFSARQTRRFQSWSQGCLFLGLSPNLGACPRLLFCFVRGTTFCRDWRLAQTRMNSCLFLYTARLFPYIGNACPAVKSVKYGH